ncbi:TlpA family protein disulfide reductase [Pseudoalteromonas sp. PPB1]|uniref:TlpA family protein disulfide reductase n=1 Tax=Pseudoalteromonas sp. PPB1 TaxID=2756136 RepID=UPI0018911378|nr:TlpA disulfide reductase family protein [Pseudoalteromonas sp. PPB1]
MTKILTGILLLALSVTATAKSYPPLQADTLQGQAISSKGKITYLKFWATWCAYCVEEMPHLQQAYEQSQGRYQVIAVNVGFNQTIQGIKTYIKRHDYPFPVVFDATGDITHQYQVTGTPQHILLDANGTEIYRSALLTDELKQHLATQSGVKP